MTLKICWGYAKQVLTKRKNTWRNSGMHAALILQRPGESFRTWATGQTEVHTKMPVYFTICASMIVISETPLPTLHWHPIISLIYYEINTHFLPWMADYAKQRRIPCILRLPFLFLAKVHLPLFQQKAECRVVNIIQGRKSWPVSPDLDVMPSLFSLGQPAFYSAFKCGQ